MPAGSSPILPEGCAPTGLKYRRLITRHSGSETHMSRRISSINSFVRPYGFVAEILDDSVKGTSSGTPYTVADDEKTSAFGPTCKAPEGHLRSPCPAHYRAVNQKQGLYSMRDTLSVSF